MVTNLEKMACIDSQLRLLVPGEVSEDDKLVKYDALLLDRFLDVLQDLYSEDLRETEMPIKISSGHEEEFEESRDQVHERMLGMNTHDYGRYEPAPTLSKSHDISSSPTNQPWMQEKLN